MDNRKWISNRPIKSFLLIFNENDFDVIKNRRYSFLIERFKSISINKKIEILNILND